MTRTALPKLHVYAAIVAVGAVAAIALGRPEVEALVVPFGLFLAVALARLPAHALSVALELDRERVVEGEEVELQIGVTSPSGVARLQLQPSVPAGLERTGTPLPLVSLQREKERVLPLALRCRRWGAYGLGGLTVRAFDRFGIVVDEQTVEPALTLRVYPSAERVQRLVRPIETQPFAGNLVARTKGDGIEFADIRPFTPGDRVRKINWRVSARRAELFVNESHPERNADVVIFLDTFADARRADASTLDRAVRAASAVAHEYLETRNRVGLVDFGGIVRWLTPAGGTVQAYRIVEALLATEVALSYVGKKTDVLPPRTLPPQSLVLAFSPLLDDRGLDALADLRSRGFDLVIVDLSPLAYTEPPRDEEGELAVRLWQLWRGAIRYRYERLGVPVVEWREGEPFAAAIEEVRSFRRYARPVRV